jgi:hypothetical protein
MVLSGAGRMRRSRRASEDDHIVLTPLRAPDQSSPSSGHAPGSAA